MLKKSTALFVVPLVLFFTASPFAQARKVEPVYYPEPIEVDCKISLNKVKAAIRYGLSARRWAAKNMGSGKIRGTLNIRRHTLVVDIKYSTKSVRIRYKSSVNLNYSSGAGLIHRNANNWIRNIENDIRFRLSTYC